MALWTPYADEVALDLSKSIKQAHETNITRYDHDQCLYTVSPQEVHSIYSFEYPYAPIPQVSPLSGGSISSYYDRSLSPVRPVTLSPPDSPVSSSKRAYSMIDDSLSDDPDFQAFEKDALRAMAEKNGGPLLGNNPRMRRTVHSNNDPNDHSYRRQRERNNFAAKQSRDRRKLKEIHLALKVSYLKKEVTGLKAVLAAKGCHHCQQSCLC